MQAFLAQLVNGLAMGGIYALLVLGMNLLMLVRNIVHHCFSHIVVLDVCVGWLVYTKTQSVVLAFLLMFVCGVLATVATEPLFRPLSKRGAELETIVLAMGVGIIITELIAQCFNKGQVIAVPNELKLVNKQIRWGVVSFSVGDIIAIAVCIVAALLIVWFLFKTSEGRAIRSMALNLRVSRMLGVPFGRTGVIGFGIAGLLTAVIALVWMMCMGYANSELGDSLAVKAIILMLFAGQGDIRGGILSSFLMGVVESMATTYLPGKWTNAIFYGAIMLIIIWRPNGLFAKQAKD